jgi:alpha-tubulin suppressor-like RCC1 family protein
VGSVAVGGRRSFALSDTGEVWAWGIENGEFSSLPLGHGEEVNCLLPKPIESLRGVKVDAVVAGPHQTLALCDDGSVYAWGDYKAAFHGVLGLGNSVGRAGKEVRTPRRIQALRLCLASAAQ